MNYFESLPYEVVEKILFSVPNVYYFSTLNIINRFWNQIISQKSQLNIKNQYLNCSTELLLCHYQDIGYPGELYIDGFGLNLIHQFVTDRKDFDLFLIPYGIFNDHQLDFFKTLLMINYDFLNYI